MMAPRNGESRGKPTVSSGWKAGVLGALWRVRRTPPGSAGAADKASIERVQVPPSPLLESDMSRCHRAWWVTPRAVRGVNGLAALWRVTALSR